MEALYPCGPTFHPYTGGFHKHFLHWTKDGSQLVIDLDETIWTVDIGGAHLRKIADANPGPDWELTYGYHADVSSDGSRIVHATCEYPLNPSHEHDKGDPRKNLGYEIATVNIDGTEPQRLTNNRRFDNYPVWSPDGTQIAFVADARRKSYNSYEHPGHYNSFTAQLFTMSADGTGVPKVVSMVGGVGLYPPVWSPDSQRLAFIVNEGERVTEWEPFKRILYTVRADGSELSKIGETTSLPTWSPDSERLAFAMGDADKTGVYTVRFNGTDLRLVLDEFRASQVSWSPDGSELLLAADQLFVVRPDGSGLRRLGPSNPTTQIPHLRLLGWLLWAYSRCGVSAGVLIGLYAASLRGLATVSRQLWSLSG